MSTLQESDQVVQRRANLEELKKLGVDPYPHRFEADASIEAVVGQYKRNIWKHYSLRRWACD